MRGRLSKNRGGKRKYFRVIGRATMAAPFANFYSAKEGLTESRRPGKPHTAYINFSSGESLPYSLEKCSGTSE